MEGTRIITGHQALEDDTLELTLRPQRFSDYIGQMRVKEQLSIFIAAALERGDSLDHVLLYGPPGLGKTTLAHIVAKEMGVNLRITSGPAIERAGDLAAILTSLMDGDVLFIDEIHRLSRTVEEILYPAMEDGVLDLILGKGPAARSVRLDLPRFTLVGATTRAGMLSSPLRDRFGVLCRLEYYTTEELTEVVLRAAAILGAVIDTDGSRHVALRSRGTPRVANRLLRRLRDYAQIRAGGHISEQVAKEGLDLLEVDPVGLDRSDRHLLTAILEKYKGGPVGIDTIAALLSEAPDTIEDIYEPYLMQIGFLARTSRGRVVTDLARTHLGYPMVASEEAGLF